MKLLPQATMLHGEIILEGLVLEKLKQLHDYVVRILKQNLYKKIKSKTVRCFRGLRKLLKRNQNIKNDRSRSPNSQKLRADDEIEEKAGFEPIAKIQVVDIGLDNAAE